jgi:tetratricopeptide (TPR) repeat protein
MRYKLFVKHFWVNAAVAMLIGGLLVACSSERNTLTSRTYHNVLAKYNGYFLAREKMKEVEISIIKAHKENYNRILEIQQPLTPATETTVKPLTEEIVKKASIPVQRHKNSDWVDDSYILIGKARYYQSDWENAVTTFRYIYGKGKGKDEKQLALIWLLRTYTAANEPRMAAVVRDVLAKDKENLSKANQREYRLALAQAHYKEKEYKDVADNLEVALPLMRKGEARARLHYALAQIRQKQGIDSAAFRHFKAVLKNNPSYELSFYTKLNLGLVTAISDEKGKKKIRKYFKKMLKDQKNEEYRDRIYYEMARFELRQGNTTKAIEHFKTSLRQPTLNPNQKAYAYLRLGEVYYDKLRRYELAKEYYDSTILAPLDTNEENYAAILKRQKVLGDFVKQYNIVQREDSLQRLAGMDSASLFASIDKMVAGDIERDKAEAKRKEKEAKRAAAAAAGGSASIFDNRSGLGFDAGGGQAKDGQAQWALSNPAAISAGRAAFLKKWGNRPLEDNWRRARKETQAIEDAAPVAKTEPTDSTKAVDSTQAKAPEKGKEKPEKEGAKPAERNRANYVKDIPRTPEALAASNGRLRPALYKLGKIYRQQLEETDNATVVFERLVNRFYDDEKVPEVLYFLYIIYQEKGMADKQEMYKQKLLKDFPKSVYARLLLNPNYLVESKAADEAAQAEYKQAYLLYEQNRMAEASVAIAMVREKYPETTIMDKIKLLETLIAGRTLDIADYKTRINEFMTAYPKSELMPTAREMLRVAELVASGKTATGGVSEATAQTEKDAAAAASIYSTNLDQPHYFIAVLPMNKIPNQEAMNKISDFNRVYYTTETFTVSDLLLDEKNYVVKVWELPTKIQAINYLRKQKSEKGSLQSFKNVEKHLFVITQDNLKAFYKSKNIREYTEFFNKNYKETIE